MNYFKKSNEDKLVCLLCSYYCDLKEDQIGICGVNKHTKDKVECLVYGHISAFNIDPIEKKPLYHFLPKSKSLSLGTVGCNFHCNFCQNHGISQEKKIDKSNYTSPKRVVEIAREKKCASISYTYNEPTIFYPYAKDIALEAKKYGIKSVFVSNGFESSEVIDDMKGVIDAINVDLKSFNEKYYKTKLGGNLQQVLDNLVHLQKNGIWIEITTLIVPTRNDSKEELTKIVKWIKNNLGANVPWHISAFHPDYKELSLPRTSFETLKMAYDIAKKEGLNYVYIGNIGYENNTICPKCSKKVISREYFNVKSEELENGKCPNCKEKIHGVFFKNKELDMSVRKTAVAGTFYPNDKKEIKNYIEQFNKGFSVKKMDVKPRAIISPHAGYIYSGFTANLAYNLSSQEQFKRVIVIGPSHKVYLEGASIALYNEFETPLGNIKIDLPYSKKLKDKYEFLSFLEKAHHEHSTETQAPFIKNYFDGLEMIEIVYGKLQFELLSKLIDELLEDKSNFIIISTDLSHFYTLEEAKKLDNICLNAISRRDINIFNQGGEACGMIGVKAMIQSCLKNNLTTNVLHYCTSYDRTKDKSRVVGYTSVLIGEKV